MAITNGSSLPVSRIDQTATVEYEAVLTTGSGLSQLVDAVLYDPGLSGRISSLDIKTGAKAAEEMNTILVEAIDYTGAGKDGVFTVEEVKDINKYIRDHYLTEWAKLHGDDETGEETGFHLVQNDGATSQYRGNNLINTVADGIYHLGFEIQGDTILNEDGNPNATLLQLSEWLTQFYTDHSTTGTGLDRITDLIMADKGLDQNIPDKEIATAADTANRMNEILYEAIKNTEVAVDGTITAEDIRKINGYIREHYLDEWTKLHGDDEPTEETGFHLVQNDGASTRMFGKNFVNTVADGIYHLGFEIKGDYILNEDGKQNASLSDLASWVQYFYVDQSKTDTGLDRLTDAVLKDTGLAANTSAADINAGAAAADALNTILKKAITETHAADDGIITPDDVRTINSYIQSNYQDKWIELHGDDEDGLETGYHLVQNDGSSINFRGDNLLNTVVDGIYHLGFEIQGDTVLNEDGNPNADVADLATWLNYFYLDKEIIFGTNSSETIKGLDIAEQIYAQDGDDCVYADAGNDTVNGGKGNDYLSGGADNDILTDELGSNKLYGGDGNDILTAGDGNDTLSGDNGNDSITTGNGFNLVYGGSGIDTIEAGIGDDTLYGQDGVDRLFGREGNDYLSGGADNDILTDELGSNKLYGGDGNDILSAGAGNDTLSGDNGDDSITAGDGSNLVYGGDGNDILTAGAGNDTLSGDNGDDSITAGDGSDLLYGGAGIDT
ncbi:MAG: calcium-binding protein, partial [Chlorobiaceae bacterium]|nr:calcium-binding protein [Chlorobiaceae bacterium]